MTEPPPSAAAGWYVAGDGRSRYWDGNAWLDVPDPRTTSSVPRAQAADPVVTKAPARVPSAAPAVGRKKATPKEKVVVFVMVVIVGLLIAGVSTVLGSGQNDFTEGAAWVACQNQETQQLVAPSTAGYPTLAEVTGSQTAKTWAFDRAWVDAQNSFGAMVRTYFFCSVLDEGGGNVLVTVRPS